MHIVATAGHVDHGKSTLVRALTGMEPDRWAEEQRRGMTIDLGYAWVSLPSGRTVAFVDVPGHERFLGNMLAGLGPVSSVLFVVAADEGWRAQSAEHLQAVNALGLTSGLLVITRADLADPTPALESARRELSASSLGEVPAVAVSAVTGVGMPELADALDRMAAVAPVPDADAPVRLWVDRRFSVRGSGTVVTGTLPAGTIRTGDELLLRDRLVRVRGLQSLGRATELVTGPTRVALNLRAVETADVSRGDTLTSPGRWHSTSVIDVRLGTEIDRSGQVIVHLGTDAQAAHLRPLGSDTARLQLARPLPLRPGDRGLLTNPTTRRVTTGLTVLDVEPPELRRRGSAAARARVLAGDNDAAILPSRGAMRQSDLAALGVVASPTDSISIGEWAVAKVRLAEWANRLTKLCRDCLERDPMRPGVSDAAAVAALGLPDRVLLPAVVNAAGLSRMGGSVFVPGAEPRLGAAESGLQELEHALSKNPFDAPSRPQLQEWGLHTRELATAARLGRIVRIAADIVLLPEAPDQAVELLRKLPQPFSTSQARQQLATTRRVAIPLLEYLDSAHLTERISPDLRRVVDRSEPA